MHEPTDQTHREGQDNSVAGESSKATPSETKRLPITNLPRPLKPVAGGPGPPPSLIVTIPRIVIDYPPDFPEPARKRVFRAQVRAADAMDEKRPSIRWEEDLEAALLTLMLSIFSAYAKEACELGQQEVWSAERCESENLNLLQQLARAARLVEDGQIRSKLQARIERSDEWKDYRRRLRNVADAQAAGGPQPSKTPSVIGAGERSDPGALSPGREFPRFMYHASLASKMVSSTQEEVGLGPEWSRVYIHQNYPKVKYHSTKPPVTVKTAEEEAALEAGWTDTPDALEPGNIGRPTPMEQRDPSRPKESGADSVARLHALRFALRRQFQEGQTTPLKSWEEVRAAMSAMADDESIPIDLRTKIRDELNPQDETVRGMLEATSAEARKEAGRTIIDRVLEPAEATLFRKSPAYRDLVVAEHYQKLTARGFDDLESEDAIFFAGVLNAAQRATAIKLNGRLDRPLRREEQHNLLRGFSADHLGLSGHQLASALQGSEWRDRYLAWLIRHVKVRGTPGAPKKTEAEKTRALWVKMGKPTRLTAEVCDALAKDTYAAEFSKAPPRSPARRKLRDRVAQQIRPLLKKQAPPGRTI